MSILNCILAAALFFIDVYEINFVFVLNFILFFLVLLRIILVSVVTSVEDLIVP